MNETAPLTRDAFVERLRQEGAARYHDHHRYHALMHEGKLSRLQLQQWVLNRYYYQTRIPIKDAIILSKSEDPAFRRMWIRRIQDHDGQQEGEGGLALWLRLAEGVGLDREEVASCRSVLPGVRFACDGYVELVRERSLVEAVASSLTEFFAPDLMSRRIQAWEQHYPWVSAEMLAYFRSRVPRARQDSLEAHRFRGAPRHDAGAPGAVRRRAHPEDRDPLAPARLRLRRLHRARLGAGGAARVIDAASRPRLAAKARLRYDRQEARYLLLYPERGLALNGTALDVVRLCTGERTVAGIVDAAGAGSTPTSRGKWWSARC